MDLSFVCCCFVGEPEVENGKWKCKGKEENVGVVDSVRGLWCM